LPTATPLAPQHLRCQQALLLLLLVLVLQLLLVLVLVLQLLSHLHHAHLLQKKAQIRDLAKVNFFFAKKNARRAPSKTATSSDFCTFAYVSDKLYLISGTQVRQNLKLVGLKCSKTSTLHVCIRFWQSFTFVFAIANIPPASV